MPSCLFIVMSASIGMYTPLEVLQAPLMVGLFSMGTLLAALIAFFYSLLVLRLQAPEPVNRCRRRASITWCSIRC